ncbi:[histone H3]-dimethyl-L-lysine(36) demethylase [Malassezia cuniculi]|uniref:[histone H3]-dimethyl-L-lysine(36) demethylase n=1 Tax=Malassezia cuniculi TaxID=948313 RepID=A0AAF0EZH4_9BASI|nr:[histone H3]-dimethyl-L-lysine(36) demethylase [Malassezia cuniculi]
MTDPEEYDRWYCDACQQKGLAHVRRAPRRKSGREKPKTDYAAVEDGRPSAPLERWALYMKEYADAPSCARIVSGDTWTPEWLMQPDALISPSLVPADEKKNIKGLQVPPQTMKVRDIAEILGDDTPVEVIDVVTQMSFPWTLGDWTKYFELPADERERILNIISLEVTGTRLGEMISAPAMVYVNDWVERDWPKSHRPLAQDSSKWPKVQRYILMGVQGAFTGESVLTDFHIDFAASMVYYHVLWGHKVFLFAPPTSSNLAAYRAWTSSSRQEAEWLGDKLQRMTRVEISAGETLFIPPGWIHAVHTAQDSLVIGGNFLSDCDVPMHFKLEELELATGVPRKFRFPHLVRLAWYVAFGWHQRLLKDDVSPNVKDGILALCNRLETEVHRIDGCVLKQHISKVQRAAYDAVPWDVVPDPKALLFAIRVLLEQPKKRKREDSE